MKKVIYSACAIALISAAVISCKKSSSKEESLSLSADEKSLISSVGFSSKNAQKANGGYIIEGDIFLTAEQLNGMKGQQPDHELVIANEEHYTTTNLVSFPATGQRTITVSLGSGFPAYYSTALNNALARYNNLNLRLRFQRVATGGNIAIAAADLGLVGGNCALGLASGFPTGGNPGPGFTLSNSSCALGFLTDVNKVDEVMAHEIGHCIGFRHTDFMNRFSCGPFYNNEGTAGVGAVYIPGTPGFVLGNNSSWMMACTNNNPSFTAEDAYALDYVY